MIIRYFIGIIWLLLFLPTVSSAQATLRAELSGTEIMIGDQVNLEIRVNLPEQAEISVDLRPIDDADNLEVVRESEPVVQETAQGVFLSKNIIITSFEAGEYIIPALSVAIRYAGGGQEDLRTNEIPLKVTTVAVNSDSLQLAPIKDIYREDFAFRDALPYLLAGIAVLALLGFLGWWFFVRKNEPEPEIVPTAYRSLHDIALEKLDQLEKEKRWQQGQIKSYYSRMTFVAREYLEHRFKIPALENTTGEILQNLEAKHEIDEQHLQQLRHILTASDMVKFAKAQPAATFHTEALEVTREFIQTTKDTEGELVPIVVAATAPTLQNMVGTVGSDHTSTLPDSLDIHILPEEMVQKDQPKIIEPADFWSRFFARIFDGLLAAWLSFYLALSVIIFFIRDFYVAGTPIPAWSIAVSVLYCLFFYWLFFAFAPYRLGADPGKILLRIRTVDMEEQPLDLKQASLRFFGKFLTEILLGIGYLTYFFTNPRQTLPDLIAGTKVIEGKPVRYDELERSPSSGFITTSHKPAGLWRRFFANMLDGFLWIVIVVIYILIMGWSISSSGIQTGEADLLISSIVLITILLLIFWYFPYMTSRYGGTPGNLALGLQIVDMEGHKISLKRASLRLLGTILMDLTLRLGFIFYYIDKKHRQALPDIIANTQVIVKPKKNDQVLLDHFDN